MDRSLSSPYNRFSEVDVSTYKESTDEAYVTQPIFIRYLEPKDSVPAGSDVSLPPGPPPAPIMLFQESERRPTPDPIVFRELPPALDKKLNINVMQTPPRPVVVEKMPKAIPKPPPILIERWLPPKTKEVITTEKPKNGVKLKRKVVIVERAKPNVTVVKEFVNLGTKKVDMKEYLASLNGLTKQAAIDGKSIFLETTMDIDSFKKEVGEKYDETRQREGLYTILDSGQVRI